MRVPGVFTYLAIVAVLYGAGAFRTPDVWWHLAGGEWMLQTGEIPPRADPFSAIAAGERWVNHSWLAQLVFAALNRMAGLKAVEALKIILIYTAAAALWAIVRRRHPFAPPWLPLLFAALYFPAQWFHVTARPQLFSHLFFALFVYWTRARRQPVLCASAMVIWANTHAACFAGVIYMAMWAAGETIDRSLRHARHRRGRWDVRSSAWIGAGLTGLAPLLNPYGWRLYAYPFEIAGLSGAARPQEWLPPDFHPMLWPFWLLLILTAAIMPFRRTRPEWRGLLPLAAFAGLALTGRRHVEFFNILALVALADALAVLRGSRGRAAPRPVHPLKPATAWSLWCGWAPWAPLPLVAGLPILIAPMSESLSLTGGVESLFPRVGVDFLLPRSEPIRVFNSHALGGYVIWRGMQYDAPGSIGVEALRRTIDAMAPAESDGAQAPGARSGAAIANESARADQPTSPGLAGSMSSADAAPTATLRVEEAVSTPRTPDADRGSPAKRLQPPPSSPLSEARKVWDRTFAFGSNPLAPLRPFIDGRTSLFSREVHEHYLEILRAEDEDYVERLLEYYEIDAVLLLSPYVEQVSFRFEGVPREPSVKPLFEFLLQSPRWTLALEKDRVAIFLRVAGEIQSGAEKGE